MKKFLHEQEYVEVGFIRKAYGYQGAVRVGCEEVFAEDIIEAVFIFIEIRGLKVPFKVIEVSTEKDIVIKFETVNSEKTVASILGQKMYLLKSDITHAQDVISDQELLNKWVGYTLKDATSEEIYEIIGIEEFPQQLMAVIVKNDNELFIPLNEQFLEGIDDEQKILFMKLPEGILDL